MQVVTVADLNAQEDRSVTHIVMDPLGGILAQSSSEFDAGKAALRYARGHLGKTARIFQLAGTVSTDIGEAEWNEIELVDSDS